MFTDENTSGFNDTTRTKMNDELLFAMARPEFVNLSLGDWYQREQWESEKILKKYGGA
jgi:hypothetical protein